MNNKGQIQLGIVITTILSAMGILGGGIYFLSGKFSEVNKIDMNQEGRISSIEMKLGRIDYIESKLDRLLEKQGINPQNVKLNYSTSTK